MISEGALTAAVTGALGTGPVQNDGGILTFADEASAESASITNNGELGFYNSSTAGSATITNEADDILAFLDHSTAGSATITNNGLLGFVRTSTAGDARLINEADGTVDFSLSTGPAGDGEISAGSIAGAGDYYLGSNTLTVGGNNRNTTVSGVISDCGESGDACFDGGATGGALVKTGAGTLTLTGTNTYSGATSVDAGTLVVDGSIASSAVTVNDGALLGGSGTVGTTTIASGGTLAPGNSIGTLTVDGDITFASGATYEVEVDPGGTDSDLIVAAGQAVLEGGAVVHIGADGTYDPSATYTILTADGGIDGAFDGVSSNFAFLDPTLRHSANDVTLTLQRNDVGFADIGATRNQIATAEGAESLGMGNAVFDAVVQLRDDPAVIRAAFDRLSGEIHASAKTALLEDSRRRKRCAAICGGALAVGALGALNKTEAVVRAIRHGLIPLNL